MLNQYFYALLTTGIVHLSLALFVLFKGIRNRINQTYALYSASIAIWAIFEAYGITAHDRSLALLLWRINHMGVIFIPIGFVHFVYCAVNVNSGKRKFIPLSYIVASIFVGLNCTKLLILEVVPKFSFRWFINPGYFYYLFFTIWCCWILYGLFELFRGYFKSTGAERNKLKYFCWSMLIAYAGGVPNFFPTFNIEIPILMPFGTYAIAIYAGFTAYAMLRYQLMDVNIALTRVGIFVIVYTLVLGIPFWFGVRTDLWVQSTIIMAILATTGPFIYLSIQRRAERMLRKEQLEYQEKLRNASSTMMLSKDLDNLLKVIVLNAVDIVKVKWAGIYLKDDKQSKYLLKHHRSRGEKIDLPKEITDDSDFVKRLYNSKLPLIGEEIHSSKLRVGLAVPCFIDSNMIGFLLLGDKPNQKIYDQSDVNEFALLANQAALAIENCQFYSQERQYQQYLRVSSLDKQMAGLAHEIDNPNAAMLSALGSLELTLDDLKDIIPPDKMEYVKKKIERARFNSKRISKMITSVREFSRASTGEIKPVKFEWIVEGFFNIIEPQFKYNGVNFTQEAPNEVIWLRANKVEIEQVLVNLSINSIQAINEIWLRGENTPESKKEISFKAHKIDSSILRIDFSDTGSGITKEMLEQLFLDFVTTKGSAEGTGLGLSISRRNIQKHNGKIWAESEGVNKGATFHIELPIANDLTEKEKQAAEVERGGQGKKDMFIQDFPK